MKSLKTFYAMVYVLPVLTSCAEVRSIVYWLYVQLLSLWPDSSKVKSIHQPTKVTILLGRSYLAEQFRQIKRSLAEQYRQIKVAWQNTKFFHTFYTEAWGGLSFN